MRKYQQYSKSKESQRGYYQSPKYKEYHRNYMKKYSQSPKYKEYQKKYHQSLGYREYQRNYMREYLRKYPQLKKNEASLK